MRVSLLPQKRIFSSQMSSFLLFSCAVHHSLLAIRVYSLIGMFCGAVGCFPGIEPEIKPFKIGSKGPHPAATTVLGFKQVRILL